MERVLALSEEIEKALGKIRACPAPCEDCTVSVLLSFEQPRRIPCPIVSRGCAYGAKLEGELDRRLLKIMFDSGVPLRHIDNFGAYRETRTTEMVREWKMKGFLILTGSPGSGKSFGASCAVKKFLRSRITNWLDRATWRNAERSGGSVIWRGADEIAYDRMVVSEARNGLLLVIDDFGNEGDVPGGQAALRGVISRRYDSKLPAIITTELTMSDIRDKYGRYVAERLAEDIRYGGKIVDCGDVSIRLANNI
jgi:hypothetical protein